MLSTQQIDQFERDGYLLVSAILNSEQVSTLRSQLTIRFAEKSSYEGDLDGHPQLGSVRFDICARYPEFSWLLAHPPIVAVLRSLLGDDFVYLPEMAAHKGGYGDWHKDSTAQERAGLRFHWQPEFRIVQAAIYLQSNEPGHGGGIDVVPRSHLLPDTYLDQIDKTFGDRVRTRVKRLIAPRKKGACSVRNRAGDLVLFHFRMDHKASWPSVKGSVLQEKFAIFFACSKNDEHAKTYCRYIAGRPDYLYLKNHRYPDELLALARKHGLSLADVPPP